MHMYLIEIVFPDLKPEHLNRLYIFPMIFAFPYVKLAQQILCLIIEIGISD